MKEALVLLIAVIFIIFASISDARVVRATEMGKEAFEQLTKASTNDFIVEFRSGDVIPLQFSAEGDLFEAAPNQLSSLKIKKTFWLKIEEDKIKISFDGGHFSELKDAISGGLGVGLNNQGGATNPLEVSLKAFIK